MGLDMRVTPYLEIAQYTDVSRGSQKVRQKHDVTAGHVQIVLIGELMTRPGRRIMKSIANINTVGE